MHTHCSCQTEIADYDEMQVDAQSHDLVCVKLNFSSILVLIYSLSVIGWVVTITIILIYRNIQLFN